MRHCKSLLFASIAVFLARFASAEVLVSLDADSVNLIGGPGTTFTITGQIQNNTPYYIVPDSTDFLMPNSGGQIGGAFGVETGSGFGAYSDFVANNITDAIAPGGSYVGEIGTYTLSDSVTNSTYPTTPDDPILAPGQTDGSANGDIDVSYESFTADPFTSSNVMQVGGDLDSLAAETISVPEPRSLAALLLVLLAPLMGRRRQRA